MILALVASILAAPQAPVCADTCKETAPVSQSSLLAVAGVKNGIDCSCYWKYVKEGTEQCFSGTNPNTIDCASVPVELVKIEASSTVSPFPRNGGEFCDFKCVTFDPIRRAKFVGAYATKDDLIKPEVSCSCVWKYNREGEECSIGYLHSQNDKYVTTAPLVRVPCTQFA